MQPRPGMNLSHYRLIEQIGEGGMGLVWKATDTKLDREVAIKILPAALGEGADRLARFEREAKLLAALNHANIASIFGLHEAEGVNFLAMELVPGEDLSKRLARGPLPVEQALEIARQVAEALETAHASGVVHRDLKPANIQVCPDGKVKVLDFGLAKAFEVDRDGSGANPTMSPTLTSAGTTPGLILGTASYMSPEQARGQPADKRSDVWAFGCVLYEMVCGAQPFKGDTVSDTLASVLKIDPEWDRLSADVPPRIRTLLGRCLQKDAHRRLHDIADARIVIEEALGGVPDEVLPSAPAASRTRERLIWAALLLAAIGAAAAIGLTRRSTVDPPLRKLALGIDNHDTGYLSPPAIAPDGEHIAYVADGRLWILDLKQIEPEVVEGSDGARHPFWSPDGAWIGFGTSTKLWKVPVAGGAPSSICDLKQPMSGATWGEDDTIVIAPDLGALIRVSARGGDPETFLEVDTEKESDFHKPSHLPDGAGIVFTVHRVEGIDTLGALGPDGERRVILTVEGTRLEHPVYSSSTGHLLWVRTINNEGVWAAPFSPERLELTGVPFLVAPAGDRPSVARNGSLIYVNGSNEVTSQLALVDLRGELIQTIGDPLPGVRITTPVLSPDEEQVAVTAIENERADVWIHGVRRGTRRRFTFTKDAHDNVSAWTLDGQSLYYFSGETWTSAKLYRASADGTGEREMLVDGFGGVPSPDGKYLLFSRFKTEIDSDLWTLRLESEDARPDPFLQEPWTEEMHDLSPDGRFVAYVSRESGEPQIYLRRFPDGSGKWQVSTAGGIWPIWGVDGAKLLYFDDGSLWSVTLDTTGSPVIGAPEELFKAKEKRVVVTPWARTYDVASGDRLLVVQSVGEEVTPPIILVDNWLAEFERDR